MTPEEEASSNKEYFRRLKAGEITIVSLGRIQPIQLDTTPEEADWLRTSLYEQDRMTPKQRRLYEQAHSMPPATPATHPKQS